VGEKGRGGGGGGFSSLLFFLPSLKVPRYKRYVTPGWNSKGFRFFSNVCLCIKNTVWFFVVQ